MASGMLAEIKVSNPEAGSLRHNTSHACCQTGSLLTLVALCLNDTGTIRASWAILSASETDLECEFVGASKEGSTVHSVHLIEQWKYGAHWNIQAFSRTKLSTASLGLDFISVARMHKSPLPLPKQIRSYWISPQLRRLQFSPHLSWSVMRNSVSGNLGDGTAWCKQPTKARPCPHEYNKLCRKSQNIKSPDLTFLDTSLVSVCSPLSYQRINCIIFLALCRFLLGSPCGSANLEAWNMLLSNCQRGQSPRKYGKASQLDRMQVTTLFVSRTLNASTKERD